MSRLSCGESWRRITVAARSSECSPRACSISPSSIRNRAPRALRLHSFPDSFVPTGAAGKRRRRLNRPKKDSYPRREMAVNSGCPRRLSSRERERAMSLLGRHERRGVHHRAESVIPKLSLVSRASPKSMITGRRFPSARRSSMMVAGSMSRQAAAAADQSLQHPVGRVAERFPRQFQRSPSQVAVNVLPPETLPGATSTWPG